MLERGQGTIRNIRKIAGRERGFDIKMLTSLRKLGLVETKHILCPAIPGGAVSIYTIVYRPSQEPEPWPGAYSGTLVFGTELAWELTTSTSYADAILESTDPAEGL